MRVGVRGYFFPEGERVFFQRCGQMLLALFFVTLFTPLKVHIYQAPVFFGGDFNPYQNFYLYLSDVFFVSSLCTFAVHFFLHPQELKRLSLGGAPFLIFWLLLLTLSEISMIFSSDMILSFLLVVRFIQCFFLYLALINELISLRTLFKIFVFGLLGQSLLGVGQYILGSSMGLSFLGESPLSTGSTGVATLQFGTHEVLRAYGTFLHPNIFAAYLIFGLFSLRDVYKSRPYLYGVIGFVLFLGLLVTFSRVALFAGVVCLILAYFLMKRGVSSRVAISVGVLVVVLLASLSIVGHLLERMKFQDGQALQYRVENLTDGARLLVKYPLGAGLGESSIALQDVVTKKLSPWEYQPAHNLLLVVGNEIGVTGVVLYVTLFGGVLVALYRRRALVPEVFTLWVALGILSLSDHYLFTLYHGVILFTLFVALASLALRDPKEPPQITLVEEGTTV
jgi:hypothetical protein